MADFPIQFHDDPDPREVSEVSQRLYEYGERQTGARDGREIACFLRTDDGALRAGLYGWTWAGWLEVRLLWVREQERGQGLGGRLLAAAEDEARARGCHASILETHSFQAPDFYRHRGYEVTLALDEYPAGHQKLYMRKDLRPGPA